LVPITLNTGKPDAADNIPCQPAFDVGFEQVNIRETKTQTYDSHREHDDRQ
jgi:hypothetical protein